MALVQKRPYVEPTKTVQASLLLPLTINFLQLSPSSTGWRRNAEKENSNSNEIVIEVHRESYQAIGIVFQQQ
jgi:hypothetical protein